MRCSPTLLPAAAPDDPHLPVGTARPTGTVVHVEHTENFDGPTGDLVVDEALEHLEELADRPLREHVAAFEAVHVALQDRLAEDQQ